jgi:hypothetical protein
MESGGAELPGNEGTGGRALENVSPEERPQGLLRIVSDDERAITDALPTLAVTDPAETEALEQSMWSALITVRHPPHAAQLLPSSLDRLSAHLAGRRAITSTTPEHVYVFFRLHDDGPESRSFAEVAARQVAALLGYPETALEPVVIHPRGGDASAAKLGQVSLSESAQPHLRLV